MPGIFPAEFDRPILFFLVQVVKSEDTVAHLEQAIPAPQESIRGVPASFPFKKADIVVIDVLINAEIPGRKGDIADCAVALFLYRADTLKSFREDPDHQAAPAAEGRGSQFPVPGNIIDCLCFSRLQIQDVLPDICRAEFHTGRVIGPDAAPQRENQLFFRQSADLQRCPVTKRLLRDLPLPQKRPVLKGCQLIPYGDQRRRLPHSGGFVFVVVSQQIKDSVFVKLKQVNVQVFGRC